MSERQEFIAYFSMKIALEPAMPTYSGGFQRMLQQYVVKAYFC